MKWGLIRLMRSVALFAMVVLVVTCGPSPDAKLPSNFVGNGGESSPGVGGTSDTGGTTDNGSGGATGSGGSSLAGTGGKSGRGGETGSGGRIGTGGTGGSGGKNGSDGGQGGKISTGGRDGGGVFSGTGGSASDAGIFGAGGTKKDAGGIGGKIGADAGRGGIFGGFGDAATGGTTGGHDAATTPADANGNCVSTVVSNDYACGSTPACSACKDQNGTSKEAGCKKGIDCLAAAGASCDSNCQLNCLNQAGDSTVHVCITALQTAACGASGCGITLPPNGGG